jgi:hypothetical protein
MEKEIKEDTMRNKLLVIWALAFFPLNGLELLLYSWAGYTTAVNWYSDFLTFAVYFGGCWLLFERKEKKGE